MHLHTLVAAALCAGVIPAQISGTFSIDPAGGTGTFPSFTAAVNGLFVGGINGPVTFVVAPGSYTEAVLVPPITGMSPANPITFRARDGRGTVLLNGGAGDSFSLWGVSFLHNSSITWDGLDFMGANGHAIVTTQFCEDMEFRNCFLDGSGYINAQPGSFRNALFVINMNNNEPGWRIHHNTIKCAPRLSRQGFGLYMQSGGGLDIHHNEIDLNGADYGLYLINNNTRLDRIYNNLIYGSLNSVAGTSMNSTAAIKVDVSNFNNDISHNTFVVNIPNTGCLVATMGIQSGATRNENRMFGNVFMVTSATGSCIVSTLILSAHVFQSNGNVFHTPLGAEIGRLGPTVAGSNTLAGWQALSSQDMNSVHADPLLANTIAPPFDFHPFPGSPVTNAAVGTPSYITDDYDGRLRDAMPDAGAYESTSFAVFGTGCAGTGGLIPAIGSSGTVALGSATFAVEGTNLAPSTAAILLAGLSRTVSNGVPLPFDIGGGCFIRVSPDATFFNGTTASGTSTQPFPIPSNPAFLGLSAYFQWAVVDSAAPSLYGITVSNGGALQL